MNCRRKNCQTSHLLRFSTYFNWMCSSKIWKSLRLGFIQVCKLLNLLPINSQNNAINLKLQFYNYNLESGKHISYWKQGFSKFKFRHSGYKRDTIWTKFEWWSLPWHCQVPTCQSTFYLMLYIICFVYRL
jgi:hypothetical protein